MIYLDYQATTPLAPEAREAMLRWLDGPGGTGYGNPHSPHRLGRQAHAAVELAREQVAALFPPRGQVIFTSGATEAINLAMRGSAPAGDTSGPAGNTRPIAVSAIEHSAVRDTAFALSDKAVEIPVDSTGIADPNASLPAGTRLLGVMQVNNEIGVVQDIAAFYTRARDIGALFLCDAVQAAGKLPIAEADLIAISAHKFHGPKGVGALWVRDGVELASVSTGGKQEGGLRSGTISPALVAGMGAAAALALERMDEDARHIEGLWTLAREKFAGWILNGSAEARWHGNLNLRRNGLDVARLMSEVRDVAFSAGSACASGSGRPSHVLTALGLTRAQARSSVRLGFGRYTTREDLAAAADRIIAAAAQQG
jgi:cysteine desulfurase